MGCTCAGGRIQDGRYGSNVFRNCSYHVEDPQCPQHGAKARFMRWYADCLLCLELVSRMSRWQRFKLRWGL